MCRVCAKEKNDEYRKKHPYDAAKHRKSVLQRKYGLTLDQYQAIYDAQIGRCLICSAEEVSLVVDHDHESGLVRGLLCSNCNVALGLVKEDVRVLRSMAAYLKSAKKKNPRLKRVKGRAK